MKKLKRFINLLCFLLTVDVLYGNEEYLSELTPGASISFQHLDVNKLEVSGYSFFKYEELTKDGRKFILEKNKNTKPDGVVFTRKTLWFDATTGFPSHYVEEDLRKNYSIKNTYLGNIIKTNLNKAGKRLEFETDLGGENAVPFEVIFFFLRKNFHEILTSKNFLFTLYIPLLAIELQENGLPRSMSMIQMMVELKEQTNISTPFGLKKAQKILLLPKSGLLRAILPREKTNFEFIISLEAPYHILQFKVGKIKHILKDFSLPE